MPSALEHIDRWCAATRRQERDVHNFDLIVRRVFCAGTQQPMGAGSRAWSRVNEMRLRTSSNQDRFDRGKEVLAIWCRSSIVSVPAVILTATAVEQCAICMTGFVGPPTSHMRERSPQSWGSLKCCRKPMHSACLYKWFNVQKTGRGRSPSCPLCRHAMSGLGLRAWAGM